MSEERVSVARQAPEQSDAMSDFTGTIANGMLTGSDADFDWAAVIVLENVAPANLASASFANDVPSEGADAPSYLLFGTSGNDTLVGGYAGDYIYGLEGDDLLHGMGGNDWLDGGAGDDILDGGDGSVYPFDAIAAADTASYASAVSGVTATLLAGAASGGGGNDTLIGIENLTGSAFNDFLTGDSGANLLDGGAGIDYLAGGVGDDTYVVDAQDDLVFEEPHEGTDSVWSSASFYLYANVERLTLTGSAYFGIGNGLDNLLNGTSEANLLIGWDGSDTIHGNGGNDILWGGDGEDRIYGGEGIDYVLAGIGNDIIHGGDGADEAYGQEGNDTVFGGDDFATDILVGGDGNDIIDGGPAWDLMYGGPGDDSFYVSQQVDWVFEFAGEGIDTVFADSPNGYYLYPEVENLILRGSTAFGVGNEKDNVLVGNDAPNWLLGGTGADTLYGKGGGDILFGQSGNDTFVFERGTGGDVIGDFNPVDDTLHLVGIGYLDYAQMQSESRIVENNGDTAIDLGAGDFVVLIGVPMASLSAGDFLFSPTGVL